MAYEVSFVQNTGVLAHYMFLDKIKTFLEANGYVTLLYDTVSVERELIMKASGYSGAEEIFMGFRCYQNSAADYYNISIAGFTGYVAGNTFDTQPGAYVTSSCAHNNRIDYWMFCTPQFFAFAIKVGTPVYEHGCVGKMLPYSKPEQYPYPLIVGGTLTGRPATRFSDTSHAWPYGGSRTNFRLRLPSGVWVGPEVHPFNNEVIAGSGTASTLPNLRDTGGYYPLIPLVLMTPNEGVLGEIEGIFYVSGFNNATENTTTYDGDDYVIIQNVYRNTFTSYIAMNLEA